MPTRARQLGSRKKISLPVVVEPVFTVLETIDNGMAGSRVVLRGMLVRRTVAAADMTAFGAAAKVQPPGARRHALDATCTAGLRVQIYSLVFTLHDFSSSRTILAMRACFSLGSTAIIPLR